MAINMKMQVKEVLRAGAEPEVVALSHYSIGGGLWMATAAEELRAGYSVFLSPVRPDDVIEDDFDHRKPKPPEGDVA